ncbi:MAG: hypothetical protein M9887_09545 [Chitinophagales bacterium]|nr:hypothetical protein [Chitinophagales bacterium]
MALTSLFSCGKDENAPKKDYLENYRVQANLQFENGTIETYRGNTNPVIGAILHIGIGDQFNILDVNSDIKNGLTNYRFEMTAVIDSIGYYNFDENQIAKSGNIHIKDNELGVSLTITGKNGDVYGLATNNRKKKGTFNLEIDTIEENTLKAKFYGLLYNVSNGKELKITDGIIDSRNLQPTYNR